ncbi:MAG: hypothetical protein DRN21_04035 [Thermoplasmata archaeon]|nr:MAG: hypothetical protein DRN21_04035 [Thermoplasmata archaeon]
MKMEAVKLTTPYVILACPYEGWYERQFQYMMCIHLVFLPLVQMNTGTVFAFLILIVPENK